MAFVTPITWTTNQLVTAANNNEQIRDNMNAVWFQPAVRAFHNANQSIASATFTALAFNSERIDQSAGGASTMHDLVTNNSRLTCRVAGVYLIGACLAFAGGAGTTGQRYGELFLNATTIIDADSRPNNGTSNVFFNLSCIYPLIVGDFVECRVYQDSGGALNVITSANVSPEFWMVRVG